MIEKRVKFNTIFISDELPNDKNIEELKRWCNQLHKNKLTLPREGASTGNLSFRTEDGFIITSTTLKTKENLGIDSFVYVDNYNIYNNTIYAEGKQEPSCESIMHFLIYNTRGDINAIFHGHDVSIVKNAEKLKLPVRKSPSGQGTATWEDYELRIHKRLIDIDADDRTMRQIIRLNVSRSIFVEIELRT